MVTDESVIDQISDDWEYLCNMWKEAQSKGEKFYDQPRQAHYARLFTVFGNAIIEGYKRIIARRMNVSEGISWTELLNTLEYPRAFITVGTSDDLSRILKGVRALRDMIAHGLTSRSAREYVQKERLIIAAGLTPDGKGLRDQHCILVQQAIQDMINILGSAWVAHLSKQPRNP